MAKFGVLNNSARGDSHGRREHQFTTALFRLPTVFSQRSDLHLSRPIVTSDKNSYENRYEIGKKWGVHIDLYAWRGNGGVALIGVSCVQMLTYR